MGNITMIATVAIAVALGILMATWVEKRRTPPAAPAIREPQTVEEYINLHFGGTTY